MAQSTLFALLRFTALASGDVLYATDVSDSTQSVNGSDVGITVTNFFNTIPVPVTVTSASAVSLTVGRLGATTPAFTVDSSTGSQVAGFKVTGAATGGTVALVVTDSGSNANLTLNAKGSGTIGIGSVSTGAVTITPATTITGLLTANAGLQIAAGTSAAGRLIVEATDGLQLRGATGSSYDFTISNPGGSYIARVPTGTVNLVLLGGLTVTGAVSGITTLAGTGAISGFTTLALSSSLTMSGGAILPKVVTLTYGANIAINAALGNVFICTITNNTAYNVNTPTNPTNGQMMTLILYRDATGGTGAGAQTFTTGVSGAFSNNPGVVIGSIATHTTHWTYSSDIARWVPVLYASGVAVT